MSQVPPPPPAAPTPPPPAPQWGQPPATQSQYYSPPRTEGTAVAALIVAIVAWVVCPIVAAVIALALAHSAGNKIDASGGTLSGHGLVRAAQIIAWVQIGLITFGMVVAAIALIAADAS